MAGIFDTPTKLFSTPSNDDTEDKENIGSSDSSTDTSGTPKMNVFLSSGSDMMLGYFGGIKFLDKQNEFDVTFGKDPLLLPSNPTSIDGTVTTKVLPEFSDQCRLDIYLHACCKFYVGNAKVDENTSMMKVCREISVLSQEWRDSHGKMIVDTPEELFFKFLALAGSPPDCAKGLHIQLYSTY